MKLYKHQLKALDWCVKVEKGCIFFDMGLGKTVIACKLLNKVNVKTLITPPINTVSNWLKHIKEINKGKTIIDLNMGTKKNAELLINTDFDDNTIVVCAHSQLKPIDDLLKQKNFKCMIVDESHIMRNYSQTTRSILKVGKTSQYKYLLTGTPTGNKYNSDYYFQLKFIEGIHINKKEFEKRFVDLEVKQNYTTKIKYKKYHGNKNEEELEEILSGCSIRMVRVNETNKHKITFELNPYYNLFRRNKVLKGDDFNMYAFNSSKKYYQLKLLCSGIVEDTDFGQVRLICGDKLWWIKNKLESLKGKRVVIWYNFKPVSNNNSLSFQRLKFVFDSS